MAETNPPERLFDELRHPSVERFVASSARSLDDLQHAGPTGRSWRRCWNEASSTASSSPTCSASMMCMAATRDAALRTAAQVPVNDPLLLVSAMAAVTSHLGFGITCNVSTEPPSRLRPAHVDPRSSDGGEDRLEHRDGLSRQRGEGGPVPKKQVAHDIRYDIAEEYMEIVYRLWEESWEDEAAGARPRRRRLRRPEQGAPHRPHRHVFSRRRHPPQRTIAATHAGALPGRRGRRKGRRSRPATPSASSSVPPPNTSSHRMVAGIRKHVAAQGRRPESVLVLTMITVVVAETDAAARALHDEYRTYADREGALVMASGATGYRFLPLRVRPDHHACRNRQHAHRDRPVDGRRSQQGLDCR